MRGVPRERRAISLAPSSSSATFSRLAERRTIVARSACVVELQARDDAEAVAQGVGEHAGARGGAHQREGRQVELDRARRRPLADHDVDLVVLQRRVEDLLDDRREAVDLVDEQHVAAARGWSGSRRGRPGAPAPGPRSGAGSRPFPWRGCARAWSCPGPAARTAARDRAPRSRPRAAWMKISSWPRIFSWPTYSASVAGRSERSICSSCTEEGLAEIRRSVSTPCVRILPEPSARRGCRR